MNAERSLIASILFLGLGLGLILGFCHDSTITFGAAYPVAGASLQLVINTNGLPALAGLVSTVAGVLLLFAALVFTVLNLMAQRRMPSGERASFS